MNSRHLFSDSLNQFHRLLLGHMAMHTVEHVITDMLQCDIEILADIWLFAHHIKQVHRELVWISIMQANPLDTRDISHVGNQIRDMMLTIDIKSIIGKFLGNNLEFLHTIRYHFANFLQDFLLRAAHVLAGNNRNSAIGTMAVASFGNLHVSIVARCGEMATTITSRHLSLSQFTEKKFVVILSVKLINFRNFSFQFFLITL